MSAFWSTVVLACVASSVLMATIAHIGMGAIA